jgi:hypothetical protein
MERRELETSATQNPYWLGLQTVHMLGWDAAGISRRLERTDASPCTSCETIREASPSIVTS